MISCFGEKLSIGSAADSSLTSLSIMSPPVCVFVSVVLACFQLREDFDMGVDVQLDEEHSVHDVAALLKEFLRDMPDPLLPRELYPAFLHANCEHPNKQTHTDGD